MHLMSQSIECMARMNPTGQCSIQLVGVVGVDMLIDCLDSQNSNLAFSLHWSGRPHLCSGISRYSCSIFKERCKLSLVLSVPAFVWELNRKMEASGSCAVSLEMS